MSEENDPETEDLREDEELMPPEILEHVPEPVRERVKQSFGFISGAVSNPMTKKITSEHITKIIDSDREFTKGEMELRKSNRNYTLGYVILIIALFVFLTIYLATSNSTLYQAILTHVGAIIAGFGAGWGFNSARNR